MTDPFQTGRVRPVAMLDAAGPIGSFAEPERKTDPAMVSVLPPPGKDRVVLTVLGGASAGQVFALDGAVHVLGRGSDADVWLEDPGVSRRHARLTVARDGRFLVEDLGSTNGTFVGPARVAEAELRPGDRLQLGPHVLLRLQVVDDAEEALQRRLYESSTRDTLTRLYNRKYLNERFAAEMAYARRHRSTLAVLMLDLDDFKAVNDTHGHLAGDLVLRHVAAELIRVVRTEDLVARWGGEELVVLARETELAAAARLAERVRAAVASLALPVTSEATISVTISVGVAAFGEAAPDGVPDDVLARADARLYRAKAAGKNRVCCDDEAALTAPTPA